MHPKSQFFFRKKVSLNFNVYGQNDPITPETGGKRFFYEFFWNIWKKFVSTYIRRKIGFVWLFSRPYYSSTIEFDQDFWKFFLNRILIFLYIYIYTYEEEISIKTLLKYFFFSKYRPEYIIFVVASNNHSTYYQDWTLASLITIFRIFPK